MSRFLIKTFLVIIASITVLLSLYFFVNKLVNKRAEFKLDKSVRYLVLGHSHPECAFDDSLIANFKNCSYSGESYFYSYPKIRNLLAQNPQVKVVFFEFTDNHLDDQLMNETIWSESNICNFYPIYSPFIGQEDAGFLFKKRSKNFLLAASISIKKQLIKIVSSNYDFGKYGRYLYLVRDKTDSLIRHHKKLPVPATKADFSNNNHPNYNLAYLVKCINYCREKGVKVFLVRSPQHKIYREERNEENFNITRMHYFPDIEFLDFNNCPLPDNNFGDLEHLNFRGARRFSIWFNQLIQEGLLEAVHKQEFINSHALPF